jgi:hypothetical protein
MWWTDDDFKLQNGISRITQTGCFFMYVCFFSGNIHCQVFFDPLSSVLWSLLVLHNYLANSSRFCFRPQTWFSLGVIFIVPIWGNSQSPVFMHKNSSSFHRFVIWLRDGGAYWSFRIFLNSDCGAIFLCTPNWKWDCWMLNKSARNFSRSVNLLLDKLLRFVWSSLLSTSCLVSAILANSSRSVWFQISQASANNPCASDDKHNAPPYKIFNFLFPLGQIANYLFPRFHITNLLERISHWNIIFVSRITHGAHST